MKRVISRLPLYQGSTLKSPSQALKTVTSKEKMGVYASSDTLFKGAIFGRDSLEVAEDLLRIKPKLVENILLTLAALQGEARNDVNEEEPGKIVHEYRRKVVDKKPISGRSLEIFDQLSGHWGGDGQTLAYYGSVDATPHFLRVLGGYTQLYGQEILLNQIKLRSGDRITLALAAERALDWLLEKLQASKSGFLEYKRRNPSGLLNQVWKDSDEFYVHTTGEPVNHGQPISSIEVQAIAFDALKHASVIFEKRAPELERVAASLQEKALQIFWNSENEYFALGTDFGKSGTLRIIDTITANPAETLESGLFDGIAPAEKEKYIGGIVKMIMSEEFLTDAGIRSRGLSESRLVEFWDYHGSFTTWPKETGDIARGLRWQGFDRLSLELENRLLNTVKALRAYSEFIYVDRRGRVLGAAATPHHHAQRLIVDSSNDPEKIQAWTVSAVMNIQFNRSRASLLSYRRQKLSAYGRWQDALEKDVLQHLPLMPLFKSSKELYARYPAYPYKVKSTRKLFE